MGGVTDGGNFSKREPCGRRKLSSTARENRGHTETGMMVSITAVQNRGPGLILEIQVGIHQIDLMRGS